MSNPSRDQILSLLVSWILFTTGRRAVLEAELLILAFISEKDSFRLSSIENDASCCVI